MNIVVNVRSLEFRDDRLFILDQRLLPSEEKIIEITDIKTAYDSIKTLAVRGAPAIGVAAAYSIVVCIRGYRGLEIDIFKNKTVELIEYIKQSRPTAVNLFYALNKLNICINGYEGYKSGELYDILKSVAIDIHNEDIDTCQKIGEYGVQLLDDNDLVLTHCNAGMLATTGIGTALAPIYIATSRGMKISVCADETRPLFQGARLTAYELKKNDIPTTLLCDNMAASLMSTGVIKKVIIGCDRVAKNGDTANKIGSLNVAILADYYKIPFYVAMPFSTFDRGVESAKELADMIENRAEEEVTRINDKAIAPQNLNVYNPSFDITPYKLITAFITDKGIIKPPFDKNLTQAINGRKS